jgi:hypothetical protein
VDEKLSLKDIVAALHGPEASERKKALTWFAAGAVVTVVGAVALTGRVALAPLWVPFWVWMKLNPPKEVPAKA